MGRWGSPKKNSFTQHSTAQHARSAPGTPQLSQPDFLGSGSGRLPKTIKTDPESRKLPFPDLFGSRTDGLGAPRVNPAHERLEDVHHWEKCRQDLKQLWHLRPLCLISRTLLVDVPGTLRDTYSALCQWAHAVSTPRSMSATLVQTDPARPSKVNGAHSAARYHT